MTESGFAVIPRHVLHNTAIPAGAKLVYLALSSHYDETGTTWPSHKQLAGIAGISTSAVKRTLQILREHGLVDWAPTDPDGPYHGCNLYQLTLGQNEPPLVQNEPPPLAQDEPPPVQNEPPPLAQKEPTLGQGELQTIRTGFSTGSSEPLEPAQLSKRGGQRGVTAADPDAVERICTHLADRIEGNTGRAPTVTANWRDAIRLMMDRDHVPENLIHKAIDWAHNSEFWRCNILSAGKLREKYLTMKLQAERDRAGRNGHSTTDDRVAQGLRVRDELLAEEAARAAHTSRRELTP